MSTRLISASVRRLASSCIARVSVQFIALEMCMTTLQLATEAVDVVAFRRLTVASATTAVLALQTSSTKSKTGMYLKYNLYHLNVGSIYQYHPMLPRCTGPSLHWLAVLVPAFWLDIPVQACIILYGYTCPIKWCLNILEPYYTESKSICSRSLIIIFCLMLTEAYSSKNAFEKLNKNNCMMSGK